MNWAWLPSKNGRGAQKGNKQTRRDPVAHRLEMTRIALGYENQTEFAEKANLTQNRYSQYETGKRPLTLDAALKLKRTYGVTLDWLFAGDRNGLPHAVWSALPADLTPLKAS